MRKRAYGSPLATTFETRSDTGLRGPLPIRRSQLPSVVPKPCPDSGVSILACSSFLGHGGRDGRVCEGIKRRERELANAASNLRPATDGAPFSDRSCGPSGFVLPIASVQRGGGSTLGRKSGLRRPPGYPFSRYRNLDEPAVGTGSPTKGERKRCAKGRGRSC